MVDSANDSVARLRAALAAAERDGAEAAVAAADAARAEARERGAEQEAQCQRMRCEEKASLDHVRMPLSGLVPKTPNGPEPVA